MAHSGHTAIVQPLHSCNISVKWDVTPDTAPAYVDLRCTNGYVAANSGRTAVTLYEISHSNYDTFADE